MTYQVSPALNGKAQYHARSAPMQINTRFPRNMGTSASSNGGYYKTPSHKTILPGGHDIRHSNHRYQTSPRDNVERIKNRDKLLLNKSRNIHTGPMKADHSIGHTTKDNNYYSRTNTYHEQISPLSKRKSQSLSDLSKLHSNDISPSRKPEEKNNKYGFSILRDSADTIKNSSERISKKSEEILSNAKLKLAKLGEVKPTLHKRYGSSNNLDAVTDRIRKARIKDHMDYNGTSSRISSSVRHRRSSVDSSLVRPLSSKDDVFRSHSPVAASLQSASKKTSRSISPAYSNGLTGLRNIGNTCFMNSILQCLCKTKLLRGYFLKKNYQRDLNELHAPTKGRLATVFAQLMGDMWTKEESCITPSTLKTEVQLYARRFVGSHQHDAQEFMRFFIEGVHDDLNQVKKKPILPELDDSRLSDKEKSMEYWQRYLSRENSSVQAIFVGQLKSTLTCTTCKHCSVTFDPFWDLSLSIPRSRTDEIDIRQCFQVFTQEEVLDGDEKPTCEKCKKRRKCTKGFLIERFPKVLVIHLKRFSGQRYRTKLETKVNFPFQLNLKEFAGDESSNVRYSLYGVANHMGGTYGGHYTAYCKHPDTQKWHQYNDSRVSEIDASRVISTSAYVLFYELTS